MKLFLLVLALLASYASASIFGDYGDYDYEYEYEDDGEGGGDGGDCPKVVERPKICTTDGGLTRNGVVCRPSWTWTKGANEKFSGCISTSGRFAPYNLDKARNPINEGVDKSTWCPIVNNYSPNSRNQRSKWGFCHCVDASDFQKQGVEDGIFNRAVAGMKSLSQMGKSIVTKGQKVSEAGLEAKEEICFTSSLSTSPQKSVRCASSFRIGNKGKFGSGCISMGSVRPWGANKSLPASTLWCPTIPTYVKSSRAKRSKWGICECTPGPAYAVAAVKANAVLDLLSLLPSERRTAFWDAI